jgi:O-acetyl-ADP-ribose deacetylase (regulator of RNase III)
MLISVRGVSVGARRGDITQSDADAIVNAANNHLWMGAGVAGAIKRVGGPEIEREAVAKGPVEIGDAVVTTGGSLPSKFVIHAAVMGQELQTDETKIRKATRSTLERVRELKIRSVALPAFGTGVGGFPPARAADAMVDECVRFIIGGSAPELQRIDFVLFSEDVLQVFNERLGSVQFR